MDGKSRTGYTESGRRFKRGWVFGSHTLTWTKERSGSSQLYLLTKINRKASDIVNLGDEWRKRLDCKGSQVAHVIVNVQRAVL